MKHFIYSIAILVALILSGCARISYDATASPRVELLRNGCFQTNTDSSLYQLTKGRDLQESSGLQLIQTGLPTNEWQFTRYGEDWTKVKDIPVNTRLEVIAVFNQSWGTQGRYWLVYGRFLDSHLSEQEFVIPSAGYINSGQIWVTPASPDGNNTPVRFREYFVKRCDG